MGICIDQSTKHLKNLGYNVVRHPREGIAPLDLIGVQRGESTYIGNLGHLVEDDVSNYPNVRRGEVASDINGTRSSSLHPSVGLSILKSVLAGFGASLDIDASYQQAKGITFEYSEVVTDLVATADIGRFLRDTVIDSRNPVLQQYILGNGNLYIIVQTAKSSVLTVDVDAKSEGQVSSSAVQEAVGKGEVVVTASSSESSKLTYRGNKDLVFAFKCLHLGFKDGSIVPVSVRAGSVAMSSNAGHQVADWQVLNQHGLLDFSSDT